MEASVTEIADNVFRISVLPEGSPLDFGCFLIRDDEPAMVATGLPGLFDLNVEAVRRLVNPVSLRHILVPHFEMDECGSLNRFLALAPNARVAGSPVGAAVTLPDFSERPPEGLSHGHRLQIGRKTLQIVVTPWVHYWDSMLVYDETDRVLFTSDLFAQAGERAPVITEDISEEIVGFSQFTGLLPSQKHLERALDAIEPLGVDILACHHGGVLAGDPHRYYRAMRNNQVGDTVDAPFLYQGAAALG